MGENDRELTLEGLRTNALRILNRLSNRRPIDLISVDEVNHAKNGPALSEAIRKAIRINKITGHDKTDLDTLKAFAAEMR